MDMPINRFKRRLLAGEPQVGLWVTMPGGLHAELCAGAGFDWILFDTEHSPQDPVTVLAGLQAAAAYPVPALVRPAWNDPVLAKRLLDVGAQTLLFPFVQTPAEAAAAVASTRYPPEGVRGVATMSRATRFGRVPGYLKGAGAETCALVQVETAEALGRLEEIASVPGVDGVFVGPSDLAASLGRLGEPSHPEVAAACEDAIRRLGAVGTPAGILATDPAWARRCLDLGALFVAVGVDAAILARGADALAAAFRG